MPTISVIVPVYNTSQYLHRCVDSILAQTFTSFELLLVNDGSTDESGAICDEYAAKDSRVRVFHQENQGQAAARNHALDWLFANSDSEYISFVDSDDWVHERYLELLYRNIQDYSASISIQGCQRLTEGDNTELGDLDAIKVWDGVSFLTDCLVKYVPFKPWVLCGKLFRRTCFASIRLPEGRFYEDNAVLYKLLYYADRVVDGNVILYYYWQHADSTVHQKTEKIIRDKLLIPQEMMDFITEHELRPLLPRVNQMYLNALCDGYRDATREFNAPKLAAELKARLKEQYHHYKNYYPISIRSHPIVYEILFPVYSYFYWTINGVLLKLKRG